MFRTKGFKPTWFKGFSYLSSTAAHCPADLPRDSNCINRVFRRGIIERYEKILTGKSLLFVIDAYSKESRLLIVIGH
jgi:hypothetical protein